MNKSKTGMSLLKGVILRFIYTGFSLWMNGYRQKQLCNIVINQLQTKKVYRNYFIILYDFFLRPSCHLPAQG